MVYLQKDEELAKIVEQFVEPVGEKIRTKIKLEKVFAKYKAEKMPPPWEETLEVEKEMFFMAGKYRFVVIPDMVVRWGGAFYGIDHKHTTRLTENFFTKFKRDSQIDAQMIAISEKYGSCNGIYINGVIVRQGGPTSKEIDFIRDIAERTAEELVVSRKYFEAWAKRCEEDTEKPENRTSCFDYNDSCAYLGLCTNRYSQQEIENKYEVVPWVYKEPKEEES